MPRTSRYFRKKPTAGIIVTDRDRDVLRHVYVHRYLTSDHIRALSFAGVSERRVRDRLRHLYDWKLVDRRFLPVVLSGEKEKKLQNNRPLYCLAHLGAEVVAEDLGIDVDAIPQTPAQNEQGFATIEHNLVVTDFLVALDVACQNAGGLELASIERETALRGRLAGHFIRKHPAAKPVNVSAALRSTEFIIPDGAFTLRYEGGTDATFYIEVVRAGVRGGNRTLQQKLAKYTKLHHEQFFRDVYGHDRLRAVLFVTTSPERALNFRDLAAQLPHGRRLFWFGSYGLEREVGVPKTTFSPETILGAIWSTVEDGVLSLAPPPMQPSAASPPPASAAA